MILWKQASQWVGTKKLRRALQNEPKFRLALLLGHLARLPLESRFHSMIQCSIQKKWLENSRSVNRAKEFHTGCLNLRMRSISFLISSESSRSDRILIADIQPVSLWSALWTDPYALWIETKRRKVVVALSSTVVAKPITLLLAFVVNRILLEDSLSSSYSLHRRAPSDSRKWPITNERGPLLFFSNKPCAQSWMVYSSSTMLLYWCWWGMSAILRACIFWNYLLVLWLVSVYIE